MTVHVKIMNEPNLVRDIASGAVLSIGNSDIDSYKKRKAAACLIQTTVEDINSLKTEMHEIRQLLVRILNRGETI